MFSDDHSVDDKLPEDQKLSGHPEHHIAGHNADRTGTRDLQAILALGFRRKLTQADVSTLLSAVNRCCHYYAETSALPVTIFGQAGEGAGSTPSKPPVIYQGRFLNLVRHEDWIALIDGLNSYRRQGEACWIFARTLAGFPYHTPVLELCPETPDNVSPSIVDSRLIRLAALRLAMTSRTNTVVIAACVEMIELLVEVQADQELFQFAGRRIRGLFEATSARLWSLAGGPFSLSDLSVQPRADQHAFAEAVPFWVNASLTWLQEVIHARKSGFLPEDEFIPAAQKLFAQLPFPSGDDLPNTVRRRRRITSKSWIGRKGQQDDRRQGREDDGKGGPHGDDMQGKEEKAETYEDAWLEILADDVLEAAKAVSGGVGNIGQSGPAASESDASDQKAPSVTGKEAGSQAPEQKGDLTPDPDEVSAFSLDQRPVLRPMGFLDLLPHTDDSKRHYAEQFRSLMTNMPLTEWPSNRALMQRLEELREAMPNFGSVIDALSGDFALALRSEGPAVLKLRPILILGPPAIGKTRFTRELARVLGAESAYISVAGDADNRRFAGTAHGFSTAHPSWPVERMARLYAANPLLIVDEIEKAGGSKSNGMLTDTILGLLEPESARQFMDPFLGGPIDVSAISWIFLANSRDGLSGPLLSRLELFQVEPPGPEAFETIVQAILGEIARTQDIAQEQMPVLPATFLADLRAAYAQRRDLRRLRTTLAKALGILARYDNEHLGETLH